MIYWQLFYTFFRIGLFGFGGGFAILSLIQHDVLTAGWLTEKEFIDMVAISQMTPGPFGINIATYTGYAVTQSVLGAAVATGALILPSFLVMLTVCVLYEKIAAKYKENRYYQNNIRALRLLVLGLIATAALSLVNAEVFFDAITILIFGVALFISLLPTIFKSLPPFFKRLTHPIVLIVACGVIGWILYA